MSAEQVVTAGSHLATPDPRFAISDKEFRYLRDLIYAHTGIALSDHKRALLCARLARRLRRHGLSSYSEYYELLTERDPYGRELMEMINAITTNKTEFFRELHHFQFLGEHVFPALRAAHHRRVRIWSAATSTGEEAYSLGMTACESLPIAEYDIKILASDIDTSVLECAAEGIYSVEAVRRIPEALRARYFLRGTRTNDGFVRVKPALQSLIRFRRLNLIDESWPMHGPFDAIFCRNVFIYFDKDTQRRLVQRFAAMLQPGGHLMLGHAETIHGFDHILHMVGHSIYRRQERA